MPLRVLGDVDAQQPGFPVLDAHVTLAQLGATIAKGLHLGPGELDPRLEGLQDGVLV
jgi:hypothetical protein